MWCNHNQEKRKDGNMGCPHKNLHVMLGFSEQPETAEMILR